ncbi:MAG: NAD(P)H-binding protein [Anaerolineales bacterium]
MKPRVLVSGANGFIGRNLIPLLLEQGYPVRALTRRKQALVHAPWAEQVEIFEGDVLIPSTLKEACRGVEIAFYLIHLMGLGKDYTNMEIQAARNFSRAAAEGHVRRLIYLGGIAPPSPSLAIHLRSRLETGEALREGRVPVTELRTAIILGYGSLSFEMIRGLVENLPVIVLPPWAGNHTQPIDIDAVLAALLTTLENEETSGKIYEIGGPEIVSYAELLHSFARQGDKHPLIFHVPFPLPISLLAFITAHFSGVSYPITRALIEGLRNETRVFMPPDNTTFRRLPNIPCDESLKKAISTTHPRSLWRSWEQDCLPIRSLYTQGLLLRSECYPIRSHLLPISLKSGQAKTGTWSIETEGKNLLRITRQTPWGQLWWEWKIIPNNESPQLRQTLFFRPKGLLGRLLWPFLSTWYRIVQKPFISDDSARHPANGDGTGQSDRQRDRAG